MNQLFLVYDIFSYLFARFSLDNGEWGPWDPYDIPVTTSDNCGKMVSLTRTRRKCEKSAGPDCTYVSNPATDPIETIDFEHNPCSGKENRELLFY